MLDDISVKYSKAITNSNLILRADSGYGSDDSVEIFKATKAKFVVKGYSSQRAKNLASKVKKDDWEEIDECVDVCELPRQCDIRIILVRVLEKDGVKHTYLATNIMGFSLLSTRSVRNNNKPPAMRVRDRSYTKNHLSVKIELFKLLN